jgi:hypothetical protein
MSQKRVTFLPGFFYCVTDDNNFATARDSRSEDQKKTNLTGNNHCGTYENPGKIPSFKKKTFPRKSSF